jgi:hypothetical protein
VYPIHLFQFAILEGIETTDLLICEVRPYLSSFGNFAIILYISKQSSYDFACPVKFFKEKEQGEFNRGTLWDHTYSIGDDPLILP